MRKIMVALLIGLFLFPPTPALSKGPPLTDAELEQIAAQPEEPEPLIVSVATLHRLERGAIETSLVPSSLLVEGLVGPRILLRIDIPIIGPPVATTGTTSPPNGGR